MKKGIRYLLLSALPFTMLFQSNKADAQKWLEYSQITVPAGDTQFIRGNRVIVSSSGKTNQSGYTDICDAPKLWYIEGVSWAGEPGSHTYEFESPVTKLQFYMIHVSNLQVPEVVSFYINGNHYSLTQANLDTLTCTTPLVRHRPLELTPNGDATLNNPVPRGDWSADGIVNIYFKEGIDSLRVHNNGWGGGTPRSIGFKGIPAIARSNGDSICIGNTLKLYATPDVTGGAYDWTGPGNFTSTQQNPVIPNAGAAQEGQYIVTVTTANDTASDTIMVALNNSTSFYLKKDVACSQKVFTYNGTDYTKTGTYTQTLVNANGCDSIITLDLTFRTIIHPVINVNVFDLSTVSSYTTYQWMLNGSIIPGATNPVYTVRQNGDYQVIVTNDEGCKDTSGIYGVANYTGIEDVHSIAQQIRIYPNPAKNVVHIEAPVPIQVTISGIDGRIFKQAAGKTTVATQGLATGMYLIQVRDQEGRLLKVEKLVCE